MLVWVTVAVAVVVEADAGCVIVWVKMEVEALGQDDAAGGEDEGHEGTTGQVVAV